MFRTRVVQRRGSTRALTAVAIASLLAVPAASAQDAPAAAAATRVEILGANLNISPKRVRFDKTNRAASVYIFNQGTAPATFDIALVDRVMTPDGRITSLDEARTQPTLAPVVARLQSAKAMILASPRRVTLAPGKGQTIRLRANAPADGGAPEYRTHLTVSTLPPRDAGVTAEDAANIAPGELKFSVNSVFGLSIPLIVRTSTPDVGAKIENARIETAPISPDGVAPPRPAPVMTLDLVRTGAHSLFGNVEIRTSKERAPLGVARGVGVYTEIDRRTIQVPLSRAPRSGEVLELRFSDDDAAPGKLLASLSVATP